jgi:hypothetical protein
MDEEFQDYLYKMNDWKSKSNGDINSVQEEPKATGNACPPFVKKLKNVVAKGLLKFYGSRYSLNFGPTSADIGNSRWRPTNRKLFSSHVLESRRHSNFFIYVFGVAQFHELNVQ